jgi:hypothetical protein
MAHAFTIFPLLPPEMRLKIWNHAFYFFPRVVEVRPQILDHDIPIEHRKWDAMASTILTLLQVNSEARYEMLPRYSAPFPSRKFRPYYGTSLLISYEIDTLYFRMSFMSYVPRKTLFQHVFEDAEVEVKNNLRCMAGNDKFWRNIVPLSNGDPSLEFLEFDSFKSLQKAIVVSYLDQRLDDSDGLPRLESLEECEPRDEYGETYLTWFGKGFNYIPRDIPRSVKLCKEVEKGTRSRNIA